MNEIKVLEEAIVRLKRSMNALERAKFQNAKRTNETWYNLGLDFAVNLYKSDIESCEFQIKLLS